MPYITQVILIADHSFLGFEWQKRWCAISKTVFYYYGSDKGNSNNNDKLLKWYFDEQMNMKASVRAGNWETKVIFREQVKFLQDFFVLKQCFEF